MADVGQSPIVIDFGIEHVVTDSAPQPDASIAATETVIRVAKAAVGLALLEILDSARNPKSDVSSQIGLQRETPAHIDLVLEHEWQFQIIQIVLEMGAAYGASASLFCIVEASFQVKWNIAREWESGSDTYVEPSLHVAAVQIRVIAVDGGEGWTNAKADVRMVPTGIEAVLIGMSRLIAISLEVCSGVLAVILSIGTHDCQADEADDKDDSFHSCNL